ncbi:hypothetical protein LCGC14_0375610 [marine sediment metagenome]|uniref:Uncharacterized protein n=1 Tax=marine sediment metagenome TaxID=412755 RepID=A0A0F9WCE5_9ZZZZ
MARIERADSTVPVPVERAQLQTTVQRTPFIDPSGFPFSTESAQTLKQIGGVLKELRKRGEKARDSLSINAAGESRDLAKLQTKQFMLNNPDPDTWAEGTQKIIASQKKTFNQQKFSSEAAANEQIEQQAFENELNEGIQILTITQQVENDIDISKKNLDLKISNDDGSLTAAQDIDKQIKLTQAALERKYTKEIAAIHLEEALKQAKIGFYLNQSKLFPEDIIKEMETKKEVLRAGRRADKTLKGKGFLGELEMQDGSGKIATEISIGVELNGKETQIPTLIPTLTKKEINHLLNGKKPTDAIVKKAITHAKKRIESGESPFADTPDRDGLTAKDYDTIIASAITAQNQAEKVLDEENREAKLALYEKEDAYFADTTGEVEPLTREDFNLAWKDPEQADQHYDEYVAGQKAEQQGEVNFIKKGNPIVVARTEAIIDLNPMAITEAQLYENSTKGIGTENVTGMVDRLREAQKGLIAPITKYNTQFSTLLNAEFFGDKDEAKTSITYLELKRKMKEFIDSQKPAEAVADKFFAGLITKEFRFWGGFGGWDERGFNHTYIDIKGNKVKQRFRFGDIRTRKVGDKTINEFYAGTNDKGDALWLPRQ